MPNLPIYHQVATYLKEHQAQLVAVSKTKPIEEIQALYDAGQRVFGENRVQELREKQPILASDIQWHLIGHLQSNKVKYIAPYIHLIHSVDSIKLLAEINKQAYKNNRTIDCLLQFHIATESTKFGLSLEEAQEMLSSEAYESYENIRIVGVMGMASFTDNHQQVRQEFKTLKGIFDELKKQFFEKQESFQEISMGMSGDYKVAIEEGSTMVRIGSLLFNS